MNTSPHATNPRRLEPSSGHLIAYQGYLIDAPRFSAAGLARGIDRAMAEAVTLEPTARPGEFVATRLGSKNMYTVSRSACSCRAGALGIACKHRSLVCLVLAVVRPRGP